MVQLVRVLCLCAALVASVSALPATAATTASTAEPLMGVSRSTGLSGGDVINVWAVRLPPSTSVRVIQCDLYVDPWEGEGCAPTTTKTSGADGRLAVKVTLADPVYRNAPFGDADTVFCRADGCHMFFAWVDEEGVDRSISSGALEFTGAPATITVTPSEQLRRRQRVRASGTAYGAEGRTVRVAETACFDIVQGSGCYGERAPRFTTVREDGTWSVRYRARRFLADGTDCASPDMLGSCGLTVGVLAPDGSADLSFSNPAKGEPLAGLSFRSGS